MYYKCIIFTFRSFNLFIQNKFTLNYLINITQIVTCNIFFIWCDIYRKIIKIIFSNPFIVQKQS